MRLMAHFCLLLGSLFVVFPCFANEVNDQLKVAATDWPWWRGPQRDGTANSDQKPPAQWSATENVLWKTPVPGRGNGSPTVVGKYVYLPTADEQQDTQSVLCYDRATGKQLWQTVVHKGGGMRRNEKSTGASSTIACDGERLYVTFPNSGAAFLTALSLEGKQLWQTQFCDYQIHQGYGSSPALYQGLVFAISDHKGGGKLVAMDRKSGKVVWEHGRPKNPNYASPIILKAAGKDQLIITGCDLVSSFNPLTGKPFWEVEGATTECVTSTVTDGKHVYSSGGYPRNHTAAILADGSGKIAWESNNRVYVPSLLVRDGYLYGVMDAGVAACWKSDTGVEAWKARLGGTFSASPVLVGDKVYATNEGGETFIFQANSAKFTQIGMNKLGDEAFATPTICGSRIYTRVAEAVEGKRQEFLYCLGAK